MASFRNRRFRIPVFSRLRWAWYGSLSAIAATGGFFLLAGKNEPERIALPVIGLERLAPPVANAGMATPLRSAEGVTLAATPNLRDGGATGVITIRPGAEGAETRDGIVYADNQGPLLLNGEELLGDEGGPDYYAGEIVITLPGGATSPMNASAVLPGRPAAIPDPLPALLRSTPLGKVPRIAADGRRAVDYYAKPFDAPAASPKIAIIVGGLGLNTALTERAIDELPADVSLAFAPYAKNLEFWTQKARAAGHEVLIELPMEGRGSSQKALGAAALLSTQTPEQNLQRLDWLLSRFGGYFAATNYMGAKISADEAAMTPILARLREAGIGYIDDTGAARKAGMRAGVDWAIVNRMIPPAPDSSGRKKVRRELKALEKIATRDGAAIGKTYAYPATIDEIAAWYGELEGKGLAPAPASAILRTSRQAR